MPCIGQVSFLPRYQCRHYGGVGSVSMPCIGQVSFLPGKPQKNNGPRLRVSMPCIGQVSFLPSRSTKSSADRCAVSMPCIGQVSFLPTPPLRKPSIYAGSRACFCRYFSEYSENKPEQWVKVGRKLIVFFQIQFFKSFYAFIIPNHNREAIGILFFLQSISLVWIVN